MNRIVLVVSLLLVSATVSAQSRSYTINPESCSGAKFMTRYGLHRGDFWISGDQLVLKDGVSMLDNPPLCEPNDTTSVAARNIAKNALDSQNDVVLRAVAAVLLDQVNLIRAGLPHPLSSLTRASSTVTATTPTAHGLNPGDTVSVFGADQAGYAGVQTIVNVPTSTTFSYTIGSTPATPATGSLLYVEGSIPGPTPQVTLKQVINAVKAKIDSGAAD